MTKHQNKRIAVKHSLTRKLKDKTDGEIFKHGVLTNEQIYILQGEAIERRNRYLDSKQ